MIEYALLAGLVGLGVATRASALGDGLSTSFGKISSVIQASLSGPGEGGSGSGSGSGNGNSSNSGKGNGHAYGRGR